MKQEFTITVYTENQIGLLTRIAIIFSRRKINVESLNTSPSEIENIHRFNIVINETEEVVRKLCRQIEKQVEVLKAYYSSNDEIIWQEMALYKVPTDQVAEKVQVERLLRQYGARAVVIDLEKATVDEALEWASQEKESGLKVAQGFRAGEAAGASIPATASLDLKGVSGTLPDTDQPIRYHDEQIARSVLAHFLNLGTETGSWALGSTFADFFTQSLNAVAEQVCDVVQQHVIEDLVDLNWGGTEAAPRLRWEPIGKEHPATADAVRSLIDSHAITPDERLESYMRELHGLPVAEPATARATTASTEGKPA